MSNSPTNANATQPRHQTTFRLTANSIVPERAGSPLGAGDGRRINVDTLFADTMLESATAELRIAGVPKSATSGFSIGRFVASFVQDRENLFSDADVQRLVSKIARQTATMLKAWTRSHPVQPRLTADTIGAQPGRDPAPSSEASSAVGSCAPARPCPRAGTDPCPRAGAAARPSAPAAPPPPCGRKAARAWERRARAQPQSLPPAAAPRRRGGGKVPLCTVVHPLATDACSRKLACKSGRRAARRGLLAPDRLLPPPRAVGRGRTGAGGPHRRRRVRLGARLGARRSAPLRTH